MEEVLFKATNLPLKYWILFALSIIGLAVLGNRLLRVKHIMSVFYSFLIVFFIAFLVIVLQEPSSKIIYQGYVKSDKTNEGLEGVSVELIDYPEMRRNKIKTDKKGFFKFTNIPSERTITVVFSHSEFLEKEKKAAISRTQNEEIEEIYLIKKSKVGICEELKKIKVEANSLKKGLVKDIHKIEDSIKYYKIKEQSTLKFDTTKNNLKYNVETLGDLINQIDKDEKNCSSVDLKQQESILSERQQKINYIKFKLK